MNKETIKQKFYENNKVFFDTDILKEIYTTDAFSICNISDQCYGVFPYIVTKNGYCGVLVSSREVEAISEDSIMFNTILGDMSEEMFKKRSVMLNDSMLKKSLELQKRNKINGPTSSIDYAMEERIKFKNKTR